jgi:hypothetical protein
MSGYQVNLQSNVVNKSSIPEGWKSMVVAEEEKIQSLVDICVEVIYPL